MIASVSVCLIASVVAGLPAEARGPGVLATSPIALVVSFAVGAIVFVVTYSALRQMRTLGGGGRLVCAGCGAILSVMGLRGNSPWLAEPGAPHLAVPQSAPLIDAITIPWTALGLAVAPMIVFLFLYRAVRRLKATLYGLRGRIDATRKPTACATRKSGGNGCGARAVRGTTRTGTGGHPEAERNPQDRGRLR